MNIEVYWVNGASSIFFTDQLAFCRWCGQHQTSQLYFLGHFLIPIFGSVNLRVRVNIKIHFSLNGDWNTWPVDQQKRVLVSVLPRLPEYTLWPQSTVTIKLLLLKLRSTYLIFCSLLSCLAASITKVTRPLKAALRTPLLISLNAGFSVRRNFHIIRYDNIYKNLSAFGRKSKLTRKKERETVTTSVPFWCLCFSEDFKYRVTYPLISQKLINSAYLVFKNVHI